VFFPLSEPRRIGDAKRSDLGWSRPWTCPTRHQWKS